VIVVDSLEILCSYDGYEKNIENAGKRFDEFVSTFFYIGVRILYFV
jgi:hypothetical protein